MHLAGFRSSKSQELKSWCKGSIMIATKFQKSTKYVASDYLVVVKKLS